MRAACRLLCPPPTALRPHAALGVLESARSELWSRCWEHTRQGHTDAGDSSSSSSARAATPLPSQASSDDAVSDEPHVAPSWDPSAMATPPSPSPTPSPTCMQPPSASSLGQVRLGKVVTAMHHPPASPLPPPRSQGNNLKASAHALITPSAQHMQPEGPSSFPKAGPVSVAPATPHSSRPLSQPPTVQPGAGRTSLDTITNPASANPAGPLARITQTIQGVNIIINITGSSNPKDTLKMKTTAETVVPRELMYKTKQEEGVKSPFVGWYRSFSNALLSTFLPVGYPKTVGDNYLAFVMWSNVSNFAVTANSVLASTFLLYAVGMGDGAIATASALNWVVKDGLGQMGTLVFGKMVAHNFDIHSKTWFFLSQVKLMIAVLLEMVTILIPQHFLIMGSMANAIKGLAFMASGSTRSVFNLSYVRDNNIADITAKSTSQFIFASLFGTAAGASLCTYVEQDFELAALCYVILAGTTCISAYKTVTVIPLVTLNNARLQLLCDKFLECLLVLKESHDPEDSRPRHSYRDDSMEYDRTYDEGLIDKIPGPVSLAAEDPPLPSWLTGDQRFLSPSIKVGSSVEWVVGNDPKRILLLLTTFKYTRYMVIPTDTAIHVILHKSADSKDTCQAYMQASILRRRMKGGGGEVNWEDSADLRIALQDTLQTAERLTTPFMTALSAKGWRTEKIVVEAERRRGIW